MKSGRALSGQPDVVFSNNREYGHQMGHTQKLPNPFPKIDKFQVAACRPCGNVEADQRAETHAVHVGQIRQVEDNAFGLGHQPLHFEIKNVRPARYQFAAQSHHSLAGEAVHLNGKAGLVFEVGFFVLSGRHGRSSLSEKDLCRIDNPGEEHTS